MRETTSTNIPRALADQLPWLLFAPVLVVACADAHGERRDPAANDFDDATDPRQSANCPETRRIAFRDRAVRRLRWLACFAIVLLIPGTLPRYVLPLGAPFARLARDGRSSGRWDEASRCALALAFARIAHSRRLVLIACCAAPFFVMAVQHSARRSARRIFAALSRPRFSARRCSHSARSSLARRRRRLRPAWLAATRRGLLDGAVILYAVAAVPWINRADDRSSAGSRRSMPPSRPGEPLILYDPGYLAAIFYLRTPYRYAPTMEEIPEDAAWVLARGKERESSRRNARTLTVAQVIARKKRRRVFALATAR